MAALQWDVPGMLEQAVRLTLTSPLTQVKLHLQLQGTDWAIRAGISKPIYSWGDGFNRLKAAHGRAYFWRGNLTVCLARIASHAMDRLLGVGVATYLKQRDPTPQNHVPSIVISALVSAVATSIAFYPFELMRTHVGINPAWSFKHALHHAPRGFLSLYDGLFASLLGTVMHRMIYLHVLELLRPRKSRRNPLWTRAVATLVAQAVAYPFEVACHRLQAQSDFAAERQLYTGVFHCLRRIYFEEGWLGLYAGFWYNVVHVITFCPPNYQS